VCHAACAAEALSEKKQKRLQTYSLKPFFLFLDSRFFQDRAPREPRCGLGRRKPPHLSEAGRAEEQPDVEGSALQRPNSGLIVFRLDVFNGHHPQVFMSEDMAVKYEVADNRPPEIHQ
jgi:hypothetical protein